MSASVSRRTLLAVSTAAAVLTSSPALARETRFLRFLSLEEATFGSARNAAVTSTVFDVAVVDDGRRSSYTFAAQLGRIDDPSGSSALFIPKELEPFVLRRDNESERIDGSQTYPQSIAAVASGLQRAGSGTAGEWTSTIVIPMQGGGEASIPTSLSVRRSSAGRLILSADAPAGVAPGLRIDDLEFVALVEADYSNILVGRLYGAFSGSTGPIEIARQVACIRRDSARIDGELAQDEIDALARVRGSRNPPQDATLFDAASIGANDGAEVAVARLLFEQWSISAAAEAEARSNIAPLAIIGAGLAIDGLITAGRNLYGHLTNDKASKDWNGFIATGSGYVAERGFGANAAQRADVEMATGLVTLLAPTGALGRSASLVFRAADDLAGLAGATIRAGTQGAREATTIGVTSGVIYSYALGLVDDAQRAVVGAGALVGRALNGIDRVSHVLDDLVAFAGRPVVDAYIKANDIYGAGKSLYDRFNGDKLATDAWNGALEALSGASDWASQRTRSAADWLQQQMAGATTGSTSPTGGLNQAYIDAVMALGRGPLSPQGLAQALHADPTLAAQLGLLARNPYATGAFDPAGGQSTGGFVDLTIFDVLTFTARDFGTQDGDMLSIAVIAPSGASVLSLPSVTLTNAGQQFSVTAPAGINVLQVVALNVGSLPPNTGEISVQNVVSGNGFQQYSLDTGGVGQLRVRVLSGRPVLRRR